LGKYHSRTSATGCSGEQNPQTSVATSSRCLRLRRQRSGAHLKNKFMKTRKLQQDNQNMTEEKNDLKERFQKQIDFLIEIDKVKGIFRKTRIFNNKRYENDAEHGWHMSLMALILAEYSNETIDIAKVVKMALIHDLVEIDVGDTYLYAEYQEDKVENERKCAERVFGLLPEDQQVEFYALWEEFESKVTPEARFAGAMDRLGPVMQNYFDDGHAWKIHTVTSDKVTKVNRQIDKGSSVIWEYVQSLISGAIEKGYLQKGPDEARH
jgi:putative hydrolases of HD superfamily